MIAEERAQKEERKPYHESPSRVVWALAWPAVALNSLQVINTLLDRGFIGHLGQPAALTAHGASSSMMFLMFSIAMALGTAATAIVARAFGAESIEEYRLASREALSVSLITGVVLGVLGALTAHFAAVSILPKDAKEAIELMAKFLIVYATGLPAIYVIQTLAGSLRGVGDTKSPMVISGIQIFLHAGMNFVFVFPTRPATLPIPFSHPIHFTMPGLGMGLLGGATALSLSAWMSAIAYVSYAGKTPLGAQWRIQIPTLQWIYRILRIAVPAGTMSLLRVFSLMVFTYVLGKVNDGADAIAAMGIGFAIESIMFMPSFGLSMASSALVGQSLGMRRADRAEKLAWTAAHHAAIVTACLAGPIFLGAPAIAGMLIDNQPAVVGETISLIRFLCATEVFFAYAMVMIGAMQGAGDTTRPLWITIASLWGLRVPLTFFLALKLGMGASGAWTAMSLSQAIQGILSMIIFKQGQWKYKTV